MFRAAFLALLLVLLVGGQPASASRSGLDAGGQLGVGGQTDVFTVDSAGAINVSWVNAGGPWNGPIRISATGFMPTT